ncbi:MAG: cation:proton antiporter [Burkholderiaceae bacterium]|jgi:Kef-type K+ transport system membrane component KefB|nr:cation:proton antiporter [Burkholderiaceae bacterium]
MSLELISLLLVFVLLVVPRALQRWKIPAPLTCLALGIAAMLGLHDVFHGPLLTVAATLGISSLFLFAGLEVDLAALRRALWPLVAHLAVRSLVLTAAGGLAWRYAGLPWQAAGLLALALFTPSTGFIIETLGRLGLNDSERFWVTSKAIAGEMLALALLFVLVKVEDPLNMAFSAAILVVMAIVLPFFFMAVARWIAPYAPGSEFSLLVMAGVIAALVSYKLGVYYLVGAFITGLVARLLQTRVPRLASHDNLHALRLFASFFVPFYFFNAGLSVHANALSWTALGLGLALTVVALPLRIAIGWAERRLFGESAADSLRVSIALAPTLVFTLVLAGILHEHFGIPDVLFGGLLLYAVLTTALPSLVFNAPFDVDPAEEAPSPAPPAQ